MNLKQNILIFTLTTLTTLTGAFSSLASAADINLGTSYNGEETAMFSLRSNSQTTEVRVKISARDARCTKFRKDLCGLENQVSILEVRVPSSACHIVEQTLLSCDISGFGQTTVNVILEDGTIRNIREPSGVIQVNQQRSVDYLGDTVDAVLLNTEIWGQRADGLDPIVQAATFRSLFGNTIIQPIQSSLF